MNNSELQTYLCEYESILRDVKSKQDAIKEAASKVKIKEENSNNILVYMGTYKVDKYVTKAVEVITYENDPKAKYNRYIDIETGLQYSVNIEEIKSFEETHNVIHRDVVMNNVSLYYQNYCDVRNEFFEGVLDKPQEQVILKLNNSTKK